MPEDTKALRTGVLTASEFLQQARIAADENERQYRYVLDRVHGRVPVLLLRQRRPGLAHDVARHGSAASGLRSRGRSAVQRRRREPVRRDGRDRRPDAAAPGAGRSPRRHVGPWLRLVAPGLQPEHLAARQRLSDAEAGPQRGSAAASFEPTSTGSRTRAYGLGLNGLYINLRGRESSGIVDPRARDALVREIGDKLRAHDRPRDRNSRR